MTLRALLAALVLVACGPALAQTNVAGPRTIQCSVSQTVTASSAYASGNVVGGLGSCANAVRGEGMGGIIQSAWVSDKAGQAVPYEVWTFNANPSATTVTDKTAIAINTADLAKVAGPPIALSGVVLGASSTMGIIGFGGLGQAFKLAAGNTTLYFILVTRGTPTYASTSDLAVNFVFLPD